MRLLVLACAAAAWPAATHATGGLLGRVSLLHQRRPLLCRGWSCQAVGHSSCWSAGCCVSDREVCLVQDHLGERRKLACERCRLLLVRPSTACRELLEFPKRCQQ